MKDMVAILNLSLSQHWLTYCPLMFKIQLMICNALNIGNIFYKIFKIILFDDSNVSHFDFETDLFQPHYRLLTILLFAIWGFVGFNYMGIILASTYLIKLDTTCPTQMDLQNLDPSSSSSQCLPLTNADLVEVLVTSFAEIPGLIIAMFLIDVIGRRNTLLVGVVLFFLSCLFLNICIGGTMLSVILFTARASITACYQTLFVYAPEVYPTAFRAVALGTGLSASKVAATITPYIAQVLLVKSIHVALIIYGAAALIVLISSCLLPTDKTGKKLEEIE